MVERYELGLPLAPPTKSGRGGIQFIVFLSRLLDMQPGIKAATGVPTGGAHSELLRSIGR